MQRVTSLARHAAIALSALVSVASLAGCDSPTQVRLSTPVRMAADGKVVIFKVDNESDACLLKGGAIVFVSVSSDATGRNGLAFFYRRSLNQPRPDAFRLSTDAGSLKVTAQGLYSLSPFRGPFSWKQLGTIPAAGMHLTAAGATISVTKLRADVYEVAASGRRGSLFTGAITTGKGYVFIRDATFTATEPAYQLFSQHNCANWDIPSEATKALERVEAAFPR